jgi:hypothetical protein
VVHNLVNFHFFAYLCIRNQAKKTMEKAFVYGMSVAGNNFIDRIKKALIDKELITLEKDGIFIADCVFELWFKKEMM